VTGCTPTRNGPGSPSPWWIPAGSSSAPRTVGWCANKADNARLRQHALEFYALGLGEVYPISALHGTGTGDLLDQVVASFPREEEAEEIEAVKIAIVGRPNVGKSSLLNKLLGEERAIVSPIPGTTRDAIDTFLEWEGTPVMLIDTAGIRRRGRIERGIEKYSVIRALRAINRADVVLLLIDAIEYTKQVRSDLRFLDYVPVLFISALTGKRGFTR